MGSFWSHGKNLELSSSNIWLFFFFDVLDLEEEVLPDYKFSLCDIIYVIIKWDIWDNIAVFSLLNDSHALMKMKPCLL